MEAVIEFQGFKDNNNRYILKELAVVSSAFLIQIVFKAPYDKGLLNSKAQRTARWLSRNYHCIAWEDGFVEYDENFLRSLCKPFSVLYTKGSEKVKFLQDFHPVVMEIPCDLTLPSHVSCSCILPQHRGDVKCALRSALYYFNTLPSVKC